MGHGTGQAMGQVICHKSDGQMVNVAPCVGSKVFACHAVISCAGCVNFAGIVSNLFGLLALKLWIRQRFKDVSVHNYKQTKVLFKNVTQL